MLTKLYIFTLWMHTHIHTKPHGRPPPIFKGSAPPLYSYWSLWGPMKRETQLGVDLRCSFTILILRSIWLSVNVLAWLSCSSFFQGSQCLKATSFCLFKLPFRVRELEESRKVPEKKQTEREIVIKNGGRKAVRQDVFPFTGWVAAEYCL